MPRPARTLQKALIDEWETERSSDYLSWVNERELDENFEKLRTCVNRGQPFDTDSWIKECYRGMEA